MSTLLQKQDLTMEELQLLSSEMSKNQKSSGVSWILWLFTGGLGGHRFYLGRTGTAIAMLFTLGGLGIWAFIDLFLLSGMIRDTNNKIENETLAEIRTIRQSKKNTEEVATATEQLAGT